VTLPVVPPASAVGTNWTDYLRPLRFDHWIKNLVVPVGSALALVGNRVAPEWTTVGAAALAFLISGLVSSVNYALNEILDAPFDARHPVKKARPIPSGRVQVAPLLALTAVLALVAFLAAATWYRPAFFTANASLFVAALLYNLPPLRFKDWPFLDAVVESLTNPIRITIGWYAVSSGSGLPPVDLLLSVWAFGAFLMTGKRLAEFRLLGPLAAEYRPTFGAYSASGLLAAQLGYGVAGLVALAWLFHRDRPRLLWALPLVAALLAWALALTFERDSPLVDPEHLYRRPGFLVLAVLVFAAMLALAVV
jgi:4-hydroxybenzoate polyprenyltransferase